MANRLPLTDADGEVRELTEEDFQQAVPFSALPESLRAKLLAISRGSPKAPAKERITIHLSREVVDTFRATGQGWQTRMDAALKEWLQTHAPL
jgi:uncharacterized protein (DUF4415 family)